MPTSVFSFVVAGLAVWRLTHLLHAEEGPGGVFAKARAAAGAGILGRALGCFYCSSIWVAAPITMFFSVAWADRLLLWLALSAVAILIERWQGSTVGQALYLEDPERPAGTTEEANDVQLRQ